MKYLTFRNYLIFLLSLLLFSCGGEEEPSPSPPDPKPEEEEVVEEEMENEFAGIIRDISPSDLVAEMGIGWNLGNSFDVISKDKTEWGNPLPTTSMINVVNDMGFKTLRIPITWGFNQSSIAPYEVEAPYFSRIQRLVDHGLSRDMHVIINVHHDDDWIKPTYATAEETKERINALWTQIALHLKEYGDRLIFETLNEPRLKGSPEEWNGGTAEGRDVLNQYHKEALDAIRATGDNNAKRFVMISTYAASTVPVAIDELVIPNNDPNVIISQHSYFPWAFAGEDNGRQDWGSEEEMAALDNELDKVQRKWMTERNRAVIMGEWGARDRSNESDRIRYVTHYVKACKERGMLPIVWDDGGNFRLLDRNNLTWHFPEIAEAIVQSY